MDIGAKEPIVGGLMEQLSILRKRLAEIYTCSESLANTINGPIPSNKCHNDKQPATPSMSALCSDIDDLVSAIYSELNRAKNGLGE